MRGAVDGDQLRRRGVALITASEDGTATAGDEELLARAAVLGRVLFTQDIRFKARAEYIVRELKEVQDEIVQRARHGLRGESSFDWDRFLHRAIALGCRGQP